MRKNNNHFVAVLMGSASDLPTMQHTFDTFEYFNIPFEVRILSAHRTPQQTQAYIKDALDRDCAVFIAAAGMAAHLAGFVAAHTTKPVIGVPLANSDLNGLDALLSTLQMPGGIPVATMSIGKAGAKNAALFAASILAQTHQDIAQALTHFRAEQQSKVLSSNTNLPQDLKHYECHNIS